MNDKANLRQLLINLHVCFVVYRLDTYQRCVVCDSEDDPGCLQRLAEDGFDKYKKICTDYLDSCASYVIREFGYLIIFNGNLFATFPISSWRENGQRLSEGNRPRTDILPKYKLRYLYNYRLQLPCGTLDPRSMLPMCIEFGGLLRLSARANI